MKLIVVSNPLPVPGEHDILETLFKEGLEIFHLRKPGFSLSEMKDYLELIPGEYHDRIMLHSHRELIKRYGIKGLHGKTASPSVPGLTGITGSCSLHSLKEMASLDNNFAYVFLSPVFNSLSKPGYNSAFDLREIKKILDQRKRDLPGPEIIALGGIDENKLPQVRQLGFDGAAVLGAIWRNHGCRAVETFKKMQVVTCPIHSY